MRPLLPPDPDLELLHTREYETRVYRVSDDEFLVRGAVRDTKPPGLYVVDDPDPLAVHHMVVEMTVAVDGLVITDVDVRFETHPAPGCPSIIDHYRELIGLSIARGFTHKVRELFGGPRGCTHTTALLQAMAPAVVQTTWSLMVRRQRVAPAPPGPASPEQREASLRSNINTCHVWAEDGEHLAEVRRSTTPRPPIPVSERLVELGRDPSTWRHGT